MSANNLRVNGTRYGRTSVYTIECTLCGWGNDGFPTERNALTIGNEHTEQMHSVEEGDAILLDAAFGENSRCESGWTGDRCKLPLFHDGDHDHGDLPVVLLDNLDGRQWHLRDDADQYIPLRGQFAWVKCDEDGPENCIHGVEAVATDSTIPAGEGLCWTCWPSYWDSPRVRLDAEELDRKVAAALSTMVAARMAPDWLLEPVQS